MRRFFLFAVFSLVFFRVSTAQDADTALHRFYAWPPAADHPHANGADFWDWRTDAPRDGAAAPLVDLRSLNEAVAGQHGWVTRRGDKLFLGDGRPVRFWAVNATGNAPIADLEAFARGVAQHGVNLIRIHGGASKSLLDFKAASLDAVNRNVIDQMHRAVVAARGAGIYTFVSNSFFIIEMKVKASYGLEGYTQAWLDAHPQQHVPFGLVFLNDRLRGAFKGWLREFVTAPNPHHPERTPLARDRAVAVIEILNEDNLFFYTFKPEQWPEEQRQLAGEKFYHWLAQHRRLPTERDAESTVARVLAAWNAPLPGDALARRSLALANAGVMATPDAKNAARMADQIAFLADVQRGFHAEMTALLRDAGFGGLVSPSNWHTANPPVLLDLEHETYRQGDVIDRHAYFSPVVAQERLKHRISAGDTFLGFSMLAGPAASPTNVRQTADYPSAMSEFAWVNYNAAGVEGPLVAACYFSLTDFDLPIWFAHGKLWQDSLAKWAVGRPGVFGQFPGAALLFRRGDVAEAPVVVREGRTLASIYRREAARISPPRGFDSTRDDHTTTAHTENRTRALDPLAMMVGKVEQTFETDDDIVSPELARCIDRTNGRVASATGELVTDWRRGLFTVDTPRAQGVSGFLRAAGAVELRDVRIAGRNRFGAVLVIALDDRPLAESRRILVQVGAVDRLTGFATEAVKVDWQGRAWTGHRIVSTGGLPWQVERIHASITLKGARGRVRSATALDANLRAQSPITGKANGSDYELPLPDEALYVLVELSDRP